MYLPQPVFIIITQLLEQGRRRLGSGSAFALPMVSRILHAVQTEVVGDNVGDCLGVGSRTGPTAPDRIVDLGQLIGYTVGNVGACGGTGVCAEDDAVVEADCHAEMRRERSQLCSV